MQSVHIELFEQFQSDSYRCFNAVELYFSLDGKLKIQHNGLNKEQYYQVAIINHSDLVKIHHAKALIKVTLPLHLLMDVQSNFMNGFFDDTKLYAHEQLREHIQSMLIYDNPEHQSKTLHTLIQLMLKECYIPCDTVYLPHMHVESDMLINVLNIIHEKIEQKITLQDLAQRFFVSSSYISILFNEQLGFNFKSYTVTLKLSLSLPHLLWNNDSIYDIAQNFGFSNYSNYSKQFKNYIGVSPYTYKKTQANVNSKIVIHQKNSDIFQRLYQQFVAHTQGAKVQLDLDAILQPSRFKLPKIRVALNRLEDLWHYQQFFDSMQDVLAKQPHYLYFEEASHVAFTHNKGQQLEHLIQFMNAHHLHFSFKIASLYEFDLLEVQFLNGVKKLLHCIPTLTHALPKVNVLFDMRFLTFKDIDYLSERLARVFHTCEVELLVSHDVIHHRNAFLEEAQKLNTTISGYTFDVNDFINDELYASTSFQHMMHEWQQLMSYPSLQKSVPSLSLIGLTSTAFEKLFYKNIIHHPSDWLHFMMHTAPTFTSMNIPLVTDDTNEFGYLTTRHMQTMLPFISELLHPFTDNYIKIQHHTMYKQTDIDDTIFLTPNTLSGQREFQNEPTYYQLSSDFIRDKHLVIVRTYDDETMNIRNLIQYDDQTYIPIQHIQDIQQTQHLRKNICIHDFNNGPLEIKVLPTQLKVIHIYKQPTSLFNDLE